MGDMADAAQRLGVPVEEHSSTLRN
jgi:hypothetical protein